MIEQLLRNPVNFFNIVVVVIVSITIHEFSHAWAAHLQGDDTAEKAGRLTLNPLAHMQPVAILMLVFLGIAWGSTPVNESRFRYPWSAALVSMAGPFANLLIMIFSVTLVLLVQQNSGATTRDLMILQGFQESVVSFFSLAALLNAFLFLLNMLPIPPLDGYNVLETFVTVLRRYRSRLSQYGFFVLMILFFFLGLGGLLYQVANWMVWETTLILSGIVQAL